MWKIIDYIRSCFCKHDWELVRDAIVYDNTFEVSHGLPKGHKYVYICKKCKRMKVLKDYSW